jgi:hypothetical protein
MRSICQSRVEVDHRGARFRCGRRGHVLVTQTDLGVLNCKAENMSAFGASMFGGVRVGHE